LTSIFEWGKNPGSNISNHNQQREMGDEKSKERGKPKTLLITSYSSKPLRKT